GGGSGGRTRVSSGPRISCGRSGIGSSATNPHRRMPRHPGREIPIPHSRQPARSPVLGQPAHASRPEEPPDMFERAKTRWLDTQRPRSVSPWTARLVTCMVLGFNGAAPAQTISREQMVFLTAEWKGERFPDGRPMVPDEILARMRKVSI